MCVTDRSKGMSFAGSTKCWTIRARATPRSSIDSNKRDGGINEYLIYLACTTIYGFFLLNVEHGGISIFCHPRNPTVVLAALFPQGVIFERAGAGAGVSVWHVPFLKAELLHLNETLLAIGNHHKIHNMSTKAALVVPALRRHTSTVIVAHGLGDR